MKKTIHVMLTLITVFALSLPLASSAYATGYNDGYDYDYYDDDYGYYVDYDNSDTYGEEFVESDEESESSDSFSYGKSLLTAAVIGIIIALIVTLVLKSQLNNVHKQDSANTYLRAGSMKVTESRDLYLYRNVIRTERPKNNSKR